jgi:hypothetical protein
MLTAIRKFLSTKNQVTCILFFTYIYDLVRAGFLESRKRQLEIVRRVTGAGNRGQLAGLEPATRHSGLGQGQRSTYLRAAATEFVRRQTTALGDAQSFSTSSFSSPSTSLPPSTTSLNILRYRPLFAQRLKSTVTHADGGDAAATAIGGGGQLAKSTAGNTLDSWPPVVGCTRPRLAWSRQPASPGEVSSCQLIPEDRLPPSAWSSTVMGEVRTSVDDNELLTGQADNTQAEDYCPLGEMPKALRRYQYVSHFLVVVEFIKYSFLYSFDNEFFGTKRSYSCYIPGRVAILPNFSPTFGWLVLFYHVIYRFYLCIIRKSFYLDCFIFLLYDKQAIESIQTNLYEKLMKNSNSPEAFKIYAMNRLFFIKVVLRDESEKVIYRVKTNRSLEHWLKLKQFFNRFMLFCLANIALWGIPLTIAILLTVLSDKNFRIIYGPCDQMIDAQKNNWSLLNIHQLIWFVCDMIDTGWLLFDTTNALVWPFSSMILCAQDISYTIDELNDTLHDVTRRLKYALENIAVRYWPQQVKYDNGKQISNLLKSIEVDIQVLQSEITRMILQIKQVDEFMSKISAFCIFVWILSNLWVHFIALNRNKLVMIDAVIQFMQFTAFFALTLSFAYIAQVNTKTRRMYIRICNLVALDPNHKTTKLSWLWVLEYFNKDKPSYSFRMGPFAELTLANYLKACSWLITGAMVTINLFKYKYNTQD